MPDVKSLSPGSVGPTTPSTGLLPREQPPSETLYDLQGLVSHSGTLHGVSKASPVYFPFLLVVITTICMEL